MKIGTLAATALLFCSQLAGAQTYGQREHRQSWKHRKYGQHRH